MEMKTGSMILCVVGLLTVAGSGGADPYPVMHLKKVQAKGGWKYGSLSYLDTTYRAIRWIGGESVVTHELGHALGLGHATGENAMTPSQVWCADPKLKAKYQNKKKPAQRIVASGDRNGYRYIYVGSNSVRHRFGRPSEKIVAAGAQDESGVAQATVFPNPFNLEVTVSFELDRTASVSVRVYDELGQRVRVLAAEAERPAGSYQFVWDGLDQAGRVQASGTYFLVVSVDGTTESHKLTLLH